MSIQRHFTMPVAVVILVVVATASMPTGQLPALSYSELVSLNVTCSPKDTCIRELSESSDHSTLFDRNCACDYVCAMYGDCCIDAPPGTKATSDQDVGDWICRNLTQFDGIIMKSTCSANWTGSPEVRRLCESFSKLEQHPFSAIPTTSELSGTTYANYYCAVCNDDTSRSIVWPPMMVFHKLSQYNDTYGNITGEYIRQNIEYVKAEKTWGLRLRADDGDIYTYPGKLYRIMPEEVKNLVRPCRTSLISTCDSAWMDQTVKEKCEAYEAAVYVHDLSINVGYKNPHCAFCNYVQPSQLVCKPPSDKSEWQREAFNFQALSVGVSETSKREEKSDSRPDSNREDNVLPDSTPLSNYSQEFIRCLKVPVEPENVQAFPNGTIYIIPYDRYYEPYHYLLYNGQVLVCAFFIKDIRAEQAKLTVRFYFGPVEDNSENY